MEQSILIVDDEKDIVSMLNQYFYKIGYVVYTAINGKEAVSYTHLDVYKRQKQTCFHTSR